MSERRWFLTDAAGVEQEVTQAQYCAAEAAAGFLPKPGLGPEATASFSTDSPHLAFPAGRTES